MKKDFHDEEKEKRTVIADSPLSSRLVRDKIFFPSCMHLAYDRYDRFRSLDEEIRHTRCCGIGDRLTEMVGNWDLTTFLRASDIEPSSGRLLKRNYRDLS